MSKIDKIIQIVSNTHCTIVGLSESGKLYRFNEQYYGEGETKTHHPAQWILEIESPVVDNSACEVEGDLVREKNYQAALRAEQGLVSTVSTGGALPRGSQRWEE